MKASYNDKLVLTPYQLGQGMTSKVVGGLARPEQKSSIVSLTLLLEARLNSGEYIPAQSKVFFDEEFLSVSQEAKKIKTSSLVEGSFILMNLRDVVAIEVPEETINTGRPAPLPPSGSPQ